MARTSYHTHRGGYHHFATDAEQNHKTFHSKLLEGTGWVGEWVGGLVTHALAH